MNKPNKKIRVLIATGLYPPESGGPATFAKLVEDSLNKSQFEISIIPFSKVRKFPKVIRHLIYFLILLKKSKRIDVVLALDAISVGIPARLLASVKGIPLIVRLGGDYAWEQGKQRFGITCNLDDFYKQLDIPFILKMLRYLQSKVVRSANRVIVPSEYLKSIIINWHIKEELIEVIYSVSDLKQEEEISQSYILNNQIYKNNQPILLSVSRLVPWKGFAALIEVVNDLRNKYPNILLLIGGDGPDKCFLEEKIKKLDIGEHVKLLGLMKREEISSISSKVDMFVLNTEYEGFSHLLVECMQLGLPVLTTNVGGNPELIKHEHSGLFFRYNDKKSIKKAVIELTEDKNMQKELAVNARLVVSDFSISKSIQRLQEVLQDVVRENS